MNNVLCRPKMWNNPNPPTNWLIIPKASKYRRASSMSCMGAGRKRLTTCFRSFIMKGLNHRRWGLRYSFWLRWRPSRSMAITLVLLLKLRRIRIGTFLLKSSFKPSLTIKISKIVIFSPNSFKCVCSTQPASLNNSTFLFFRIN